MSGEVPTIAVTYDGDVEWHQGNEINHDIFTDVEDLDSDNEIQITKSDVLEGNYLTLAAEDEAFTDNEMFEASDDEEIPERAVTPIPLENLIDYGISVLETSSKDDNRNEQTESRLHTDFLGLGQQEDGGGITDVEDMAASGDEDIFPEEPEFDLDISQILDGEEISISDSMKAGSPPLSPCYTPEPGASSPLEAKHIVRRKSKKSTKKKARSPAKTQFLTPRSLSPQLSDFTDTEFIHSDTEDEEDGLQKNFKPVLIRKRKQLGLPKTNGGITDVEELSGDEANIFTIPIQNLDQKHLNNAIVPEFKETVWADNEEMSLSDTEESRTLLSRNFAHSPTSQLLSAMTKAGLKIEVLEGDGITDIEDFGDPEDIFEDNSIQEEDDQLVQPLVEMEEHYGIIKEIHKRKPMLKIRLVDEGEPLPDNEKIMTDEEVMNDSDSDNKSLPQIKKRKEFKSYENNHLTPGERFDPNVTDTEDLKSVGDEDENKIEVSKPSSACVTDIEDFSGDEDVVIRPKSPEPSDDELEDDAIGEPIRKLVLLSEGQDGKPVCMIIPLDESKTLGLFQNEVGGYTDVEDCMASGDENEQMNRIPSPELPEIEGEVIADTESIKTERKKKVRSGVNILESLTDSEDIFLDDGKKEKKRKLKPKTTNVGTKFLQVNHENENIRTTDIEDVDVTDEDIQNSDLVVIPRVEAGQSRDIDDMRTDIEDIITSSADELNLEFIPIVVTPDLRLDHHSESIVIKEGFNAYNSEEVVHRYFSVDNTYKIQDELTEVEDYATSADDEPVDHPSTPPGYTAMENSESIVYQTNTRKFDFESPEEVYHLKVNISAAEGHTSVEEYSSDDDNGESGPQNVLDDIYDSRENITLKETSRTSRSVDELASRLSVYDNGNNVCVCLTDEPDNEFCVCVDKSGALSLSRNGTTGDELDWEENEEWVEKGQSEENVRETEGEEEITRDKTNQQVATSSAGANAGVEKSRRPPLVTDISMDDETEYDVTEHDCRQQLELLHAEADEEAIDEQLDSVLAASSSSFEPFKK